MFIISGLFFLFFMLFFLIFFIWACPRARFAARGRVLRGFSACRFAATHRASRAPTPAHACTASRR
jgi:hypothetical protein